MRTKTDEEMLAAERAHAGDPERAELIGRARRFKSSWLELAEGLSEVRRHGRWKRWGHGSFEDYAKRELHLRQETVEKLTGSYSFLMKQAPEVLHRDGLSAPIPSYQSVDFLRRCEEKKGAPDEAVREIRRQVLDEAAPLAGLTRKYREVVFPIADDEKLKRETSSLRGAARRLRELLEGTGSVPRRLAVEVQSAVDKLIDALADDESAAA